MSEKFQVGQIIEGTVTGIKPFGAFVSLDETTQGLVHISHITHGYLENINDAVKVGDQVKVKILSIDTEKTKFLFLLKKHKRNLKHLLLDRLLLDHLLQKHLKKKLLQKALKIL